MEIIVEGTGTAKFTPNEIILKINFHVKGQSYNEVLELGVQNVNNFIHQILIPNGFNIDEMKTRTMVIREEQKYDKNTQTYIKDGYSYNQEATIKFDYNKERLAKIMEQTSKIENAPMLNINFGVKNEKECKKQILKIAYQEAEIRAQALAEAAGKLLKQCIRVDFRPINAEYVSQSYLASNQMLEKANFGVTSTIIKTFTPEDIELTETVYCIWIAE
ncbi:MAG: SIMPL domain-containing protein [Bacilli bacterium]|nr:SIMPL domain-containing protein [Bacilli bacterium]